MNLVLTNQGYINESGFSMEFLNSDQSVYEVIRIIDGIPLFLQDHFNRLLKSFEIGEMPFKMTYLEFRQKIAELVTLNQKKEGNVKFVYTVSDGNVQWAFIFIPHRYPAPEDYELGVETDLMMASRENPNAKIIQKNIRDKASQLIAVQNLYEVLLVDNDGLITEGSRSNVFFVKEDVFYTAPASKVLVGITRQKVFECLEQLGFVLIEEAVAASAISQFDAVFLTGTSPKVLSVRSIGDQTFDVQTPSVLKLRNGYDQMIRDYIQDNCY